MSTIRGLCRGTKLVAILGVPIFSLLFFAPYWFLLTPVICCNVIRGSTRDVGVTPPLKSLWFIGYWMAAGILSLVVLLIVYLCNRYANRAPEETDTEEASSEFLFNWRRQRSTESLVPLAIKSHVVQPLDPTKFPILRKKSRERANTEITSTVLSTPPNVQQAKAADVKSPSTESSDYHTRSKRPLVTRPSDPDLSWEDNVPWVQMRRKLISPPETPSPKKTDIPEGLDSPRTRLRKTAVHQMANDEKQREPDAFSFTVRRDRSGISFGPSTLSFQTMKVMDPAKFFHPLVEEQDDAETSALSLPTGPPMDMVPSVVQPPMKCLPPSKPSEPELHWDEDVPWVQLRRKLERVSGSPASNRSALYEPLDDSLFVLRSIFESSDSHQPEATDSLMGNVGSCRVSAGPEATDSQMGNVGSFGESEIDADSALNVPFDYLKLEEFPDYLHLTPNLSPCTSSDSPVWSDETDYRNVQVNEDAGSVPPFAEPQSAADMSAASPAAP
jgi:hypothetical protein